MVLNDRVWLGRWTWVFIWIPVVSPVLPPPIARGDGRPPCQKSCRAHAQACGSVRGAVAGVWQNRGNGRFHRAPSAPPQPHPDGDPMVVAGAARGVAARIL